MTGTIVARFFRIVRSDPPTVVDFMSNASRGKPRQEAKGETEAQWRGISVFDTEHQARLNALAFQRRGQLLLGDYIAEIQLPAEAPFQVEKTRSVGHYTLWANAELLHRHVVRVVPVEHGG